MNLNIFTAQEIENERWKPIFGYEKYEVSSLGRVRSKHSGVEKILRPVKHNCGYLQVNLCRNGKVKLFLVHRLVAGAFIPNDDETKTIINHRNEIKTDNRASNLEWCDYSYNIRYNDLHLRRKNSKRPKLSKIEKIYDPELTCRQNIEIFKEQGIEVSSVTIWKIRKNLALTRPHNVRNEIKRLYNPDLTYQQNINLFRENGVECSISTIQRLRKELGLVK